MANWGNFAGGLAQGISASLPFLMRQREQAQLMELEKQKQELAARQEEAKRLREDQANDVKAFGTAISNLKVNAPEQVPTFTSGFINRWNRKYGDMAPTLINSLKRDPEAVLDVVNSANPDQLRAIMGNEEAFLTAWPHLVEAQKTSKARQIEDQIAGATQGFVTEQSRAGMEPVDAELFAAEEVVKALREAGATDTRIEAAQKRVDKLKEQRLSLATSPTAQATIAAGGQVSGPLSGASARAAQERELELKRREAFGTTQAREQAQFAEQRFKPDEAGLLQVPPYARVAPYVEGGGLGIPGGVGGGAPGAGGLPIPPSPQTVEARKLSLSAQMDTAKEWVSKSGDASKYLPIVKTIQKTVEALGAANQGPYRGALQRKFAELTNSKDLEKFNTLASLTKYMVTAYAPDFKPLTENEATFIQEFMANPTNDINTNRTVMKLVEKALTAKIAQGNAAKTFMGNPSVEGGLFGLEQRALGGAPLTPPAALKGRGAVPGKPQPGKVSSSGVNLPVWKNFDPEVVGGIANLPSNMHRILGAIAVQETGGRNDAIHAADARGERALGAFGIKPSSGRDFGLGVISIKNPKDPMQAAQFVADAMEKLLAKYNNNPVVALAAYNQGMGAVDTYLAQAVKGEVKPDVQRAFSEGASYARSVMKRYDNISPLRTEPLPGTITQRDQPIRGVEQVPELLLGAVGGTAGAVARIGAEIALGAAGRFAARLGLRGLSPFMRGAGGAAGSAAGTYAGSRIASATFDPTLDPESEATKAVLFNFIPDAIAPLIGKLTRPAERTVTGQALENVLTVEGRKDLRPLSISESAVSQAMHNVAANSVFAGKKVIQQGEDLNKVISGAGDNYVKQFLKYEADITANYAIADSLRTAKAATDVPKIISKTIESNLGVTLQAPVTANTTLAAYIAKMKNLPKEVTFGDLDALEKNAWQAWFEIKKSGDLAAADNMAKIARSLDMARDNAMHAMGRGDAYEALKKAKELSRVQHQGMLMNDMLHNATIPGTDKLDYQKLITQLSPKALKSHPTKLEPAQVQFMTQLAQAAEEATKKNGYLRWTTMSAEATGVGALVMHSAAGAPFKALGAAVWMLGPAQIASIATNPTLKKLVLDGFTVKAGTAEVVRHASKFGALWLQEGFAPPHRIDQNAPQQQQYPVLSPQR